MISQTSKYAFRILGYLVPREGTRIPGKTIAREAEIPANYLSKILNQLCKRGIVDGQKGWGGGFRLAEGACELRIREIVEIFDGKTEVQPCFFGLDDCGRQHGRKCPFHHHWERVVKEFEIMLDAITVGELCPVPHR